MNRLDLTETQTQGISGLMEDVSHARAKGKTSCAIEAVKETVGELFHRDDEDEDQDVEENRSSRSDRRGPNLRREPTSPAYLAAKS